MYSFFYFWPLNVRTNIRIHCSLAIKNLRMESLLFLFSKKDTFIFSYIHFISIPHCFFFTLHVVRVKYTLISNYYINRRRSKKTLEL